MADVGSFLEEEHMAIFEGAGVAIVTPFKENGEISFDKLDELIEEQIAGHTDCIVSMGTTGESATTTEEEHLEVIRFTCERVKGRIPVIAGTGSNCTKTAVTLSEEAEGAGADGVLLVSPYYNKATQNGLKAHFTAVANAIKIPAVLYNIPSRTGVNIAPQTIVDLCRDVPNIVGVKEASGNFSAIAEIMQLSDGAVNLYSGNDDQIVPFMSVGGKGVISVFANVLPQEMHNICADCLKGDYARASSSFLHYLELMQAFFMDVNPIPIKEAMNQMGYQAGPCRLPLAEMSAAAKDKLAAVLRKYKLL